MITDNPADDMIISPAGDSIEPNINFELPIIQNPSLIEEIGDPVTLANYEVTLVPSVENVNVPANQINTFQRIPTSTKCPSANFFCPIRWEIFNRWNIVRFSTPMDGNCLFHAISNSFFEPYHTEELNGKHVSRNQIVAYLRQELSQKLASKISDNSNSLTYYDTLNGGNTAIFAEAVPEFKLKYMQDQLDSRFPIGYGYMEFIGNILNKDIYILEAIRRDIYVTDELAHTIKGDRRSIVLYYMNGHYELIGIQNMDGTFDTHFASDHSFIRCLHNRVQQIISQ